MHENFSRVSYSQDKGRVKKSKQFVDQVKNCARLKFRKIAAFVSKWVTIYIYPVVRGHILPKSRTCLNGRNFCSIVDRYFI